MAGLTPQGFQKKTLNQIKTEIEESLKAKFGIFINLLPSSVFGTLVGIIAERESSIWDLAQAVYLSQYPNSAGGVNLDNVAALTGHQRQKATKSYVMGQLLFGTVGLTVPQGTRVSVQGNPQAVFETTSPVTLTTGVDQIVSVGITDVPASGTFRFSFKGQVTNPIAYDAAASVVKAELELLSTIDQVQVNWGFLEPQMGYRIVHQGLDGKQEQPLLGIEDNTLEDAFGNPLTIIPGINTFGEPQGSVMMEAVDFGPTTAFANTLTEIDSPVTGLDRTINPEAAIVGRREETDAEFRARRNETLKVAGSATVDAIASRVRNIDGVIDCFIVENQGILPDGQGREGKSYETFVDGGDQQEIGDVIWKSKPAGIRTWGTITVPVFDRQGVAREVRFSRPEQVDIYFSLDLVVNSSIFPLDGAALARQAIISWGNSLGVGNNVVVYPQLIASLNHIPGILDVTVRIDTSPVSIIPGSPAVDDNLVMLGTQIATFTETNGNINVI